MKKHLDTKSLVILGVLTAILIIFSTTPIGTIPIGPLSITLNVIPIALAAISLGPLGGAVIGGLFGLLSFLQCFGIGIPSGMGAALAAINPFLAFIQRFVPRLLDGLLVGYIFKLMRKFSAPTIAGAVTGFFAAFLNTAFFMSALVLLFGNTEYVQDLIAGRNVLVFICTFVGINAVCEMVVCTIIGGAACLALDRAKLLPSKKKTN